jgi:hypothetical protein
VPPELATAVAALLLAVAALLNAEVDRRRSERSRQELHSRVEDVQKRVGADRRAGDV